MSWFNMVHYETKKIEKPTQSGDWEQQNPGLLAEKGLLQILKSVRNGFKKLNKVSLYVLWLISTFNNHGKTKTDS